MDLRISSISAGRSCVGASLAQDDEGGGASLAQDDEGRGALLAQDDEAGTVLIAPHDMRKGGQSGEVVP